MPIFGLNANPKSRRPETRSTVTRILDWGVKTGNQFILTEAAAELLLEPERGVSYDEICSSVDFLISVGGDGTILTTARLTSGCNIPILGVNTGALGFLAETHLDELEKDLVSVATGKYLVEERMTLQTSLPMEEAPVALNDVVIDRGAVGRIIRIDLYANSEPIATYHADGLIFATPTGSTAYSLSVGGPILAPGMRAIITSPISAFGFYGRPFVFSDEAELEVRVHSPHGHCALTIDGQVTYDLPEITSFTVRRAEPVVRLIRFHDSSFYQVLRGKLHWGTPPKIEQE